jgi:hypothetical protein
MSIELAVSRPYSGCGPISFSRDDQWTSFSKLGNFPLVLDLVVANVRLTRVLIDIGSGLNLLFVSNLKKMGLDITDMLTPSKAPFYGIVLGNSATPLRMVTLPVTLARGRTIGPSTSSSTWQTLSPHIMPSSEDQLWPNS